MNRGKLIVIEGTDSSGKATQTDLLYKKLKEEGRKVMKIDFPNYESESSIFVKKYLNGDYGKDADSIDPYIVSTFYTLDRFDTFKRGVEKFYLDGGILVSDRYTTANMIHQASKIEDKQLRDKFLDWLCDFEYNLYKLPEPDMVIFLDLPTEFSNKLNENRANKIDGSSTKDIHESNKLHLEKAYCNAKYVADKYNWVTIKCDSEGKVRSKENIAEEIYQEVTKII